MSEYWIRFFSRAATYRLVAINFFVGAVGLAFELVATRILAPYVGVTIYTWTSIIGVVLAALSVGYVVGGRIADKRNKLDDVIILLLGAAFTVLLVNLSKDRFLSEVSHSGLALKWQALLACVVLFSIPNILLGCTSAYLARLNINKLSKSGEKLSNIYSSGTAGSLVGTFLTGYVLLGYVGTSRIVSLLAVCLVVVSFLLLPRRFLMIKLSLLILTGLLVVFPPKPYIGGLVADINTDYSRVVIQNGEFNYRPVRFLETDSLSLQSGYFTDGKPGLVFPYVRAMAYVAGLNPNPRNYLVVGAGGFTLPSYLAKNHPNVPVDVVEIDSRLARISRQYFNFSQPRNMNIITTDGRQFINQNTKHYDLIFLDAFTSITPPFQLVTVQAAQRFSDSLSSGGTLAINIISSVRGGGSNLINSVARTYMQAFSHVEVYAASINQDSSEAQNLILIASNKPIDHAKLKDLVSQTPDKGIFDSPADINPGKGIVMTDDFAPVDRFEQSLYGD